MKPFAFLTIRWLLAMVIAIGAILIIAFDPFPAAGDVSIISLLVLGFWVIFRFRRPAGKKARMESALVCERCGYDLVHVPHPRCPECGALRGFTKSATELGIEGNEINFDSPGESR